MAAANLTGLTDQVHDGKHPRNAEQIETTPKPSEFPEPSGITPENIAATVLNRPLGPTGDTWNATTPPTGNLLPTLPKPPPAGN